MAKADPRREGLLQLREMLPVIWQESKTEWFEELLREEEFGVALEEICDYLLDDRPEVINLPIIKVVDELHKLMQVQDECVSRLTTVRDNRA